MKIHRLLVNLLLIVLYSCNSSSEHAKTELSWQEINGRSGEAIYRVRVPATWKRLNPAGTEFHEDTTQPICTYFIPDKENQATITIHNFPVREEKRIPPEAQVERWKQQLRSQEGSLTTVIPQAFAGFIGLRLEGTGTIKNQPVMVMAWAMELAPEHFVALNTQLQQASDAQEAKEIEQQCASYTIKAVGPESVMATHRHQLIAFARSFELIEELPEPL